MNLVEHPQPVESCGTVANIESSNFREGGNFRWLKLSGFFEDLEMCLSADRAPENLTVDKANIFTRGKKPPVPRF